MSEEMNVRISYPRSESDKKRMTFAFWWSVVKVVLMAVVVMGAFVSPTTNALLQQYAYSSLLSVVLLLFFVYGTYKIKEGQWRNRIAFGVCDLLFGSLVAGIVMLCCGKDA